VAETVVGYGTWVVEQKDRAGEAGSSYGESWSGEIVGGTGGGANKSFSLSGNLSWTSSVF